MIPSENIGFDCQISTKISTCFKNETKFPSSMAYFPYVCLNFFSQNHNKELAVLPTFAHQVSGYVCVNVDNLQSAVSIACLKNDTVRKHLCLNAKFPPRFSTISKN